MKAYKNPVIPTCTDGRTADPYVLRHEGKYYHCYMKKDGVYISVADELCDIGCGAETKVYNSPAEGIGSAWYAPELHRIGDSWYIYAAPQIDETGVHSMAVLQNDGADPVGTYTNKGKMQGLNDGWSIDGTVFEHEEKLYFIWTSIAEIYIAQMESPMKLSQTRTVLTRPEFEFETKTEVLVNEGPAILKHGNKIHIVYSANDSKTDDYCLGLLTYSGGDITDISSWIKSTSSVFEKTADIYGPGHCSFTTVTESGEEEDYIVYHANLERGSGWHGRSVWIQKIAWDENNMPFLGKPER